MIDDTDITFAELVPPSAPTLSQSEGPEDLAAKLESTGDFRILRRLAPRASTPTPANYDGKFAVVIDFETTGLDPTRDEIIEVGAVKFRYSRRDEITGVAGVFQSFNEPSKPIPAEITELTGITDAMVAGHTIGTALEQFVSHDVKLCISHNANFDRKFAERSWPLFEHMNWSCSMSEVAWKKQYGFGGVKLDYLLAGAGFFHGAHRAVDDCMAVLELLGHPLPGLSTTAFAALLAHARRKTIRVWAQGAPFELKDALKRRGYRWSDGSDGRPRSWHTDVDEDKRDAELKFLRQEIYQRDVDILCREITALDRFSNRV